VTLSLRYRFLFHRGDEKTGGVAEAVQAYAHEAQCAGCRPSFRPRRGLLDALPIAGLR
jgi:hypothetical protein